MAGRTLLLPVALSALLVSGPAPAQCPEYLAQAQVDTWSLTHASQMAQPLANSVSGILSRVEVEGFVYPDSPLRAEIRVLEGGLPVGPSLAEREIMLPSELGFHWLEFDFSQDGILVAPWIDLALVLHNPAYPLWVINWGLTEQLAIPGLLLDPDLGWRRADPDYSYSIRVWLCDSPVPVEGASWGRVKALYR